MPQLSELSDGTTTVGAVGLSEGTMTDHDMGGTSMLSELTVGLSDGSCHTYRIISVGAVMLSDLCHNSVINLCQTVGPGLKTTYRKSTMCRGSMLSSH